MPDVPGVVAVTGASGYIGSRLLQQLEDEPGLDKLVAFDTRPPPAPIHNIAVYRQDVARPMEGILRRHRVNTLVHLAWVANHGRNQREIRDTRNTNLQTLHGVLNSCVRSGVEHVIYLSSHTVYGAHRDNPIPLTERARLRPDQDHPSSYDIFLADQILESFGQQHPNLTVTILRSCPVLGPTARDDTVKDLFHRWLIGLDRYNPPLQFLHEDDIARILAAIIKGKCEGVYNTAGDGVAFHHEVAEIVGRKLLRLPTAMAYGLSRFTCGLGLQRRITPADLDMVRYPLVLSSGKLEHAIGYRPWYTSLETLTAYANSVLLAQDEG